MRKVYDNWERLVEAVNRREQLWQIAHEDEQSDSSSGSSSSDNDEETISRSVPMNLSVHEKKIHFVRAKKLLILARRDSYWEWTTHAKSRFSEVAVLHYGRCLDIRARIRTQTLSEIGVYSAYLVFKLTEWSNGLESAKAVVSIFSEESDRNAEERANIVHLQQVKKDVQRGKIAVRRMDGWMEVEIGNFCVDGYDEAVEARILERTSWKTGLIIEGIEFRPLHGGDRIVHQQSFDQSPKRKLNKVNDSDRDIMISRSSSDNEDNIDVTLLQEFVPLPSLPGPDHSITPKVLMHSQSKQSSIRTRIAVEDSVVSTEGSGAEMMTKLLVPRDDDQSLPTSLTSDQLFSKGYDCLSEVVYSLHGMKKMIELKQKENEDLKEKLLKCEYKAQLSLAAKESELDEFKKMVKLLKNDREKSQEEAKKAAMKIKQVEENLEKAVENYKASEELKVDKHKFASKAFAIGFEFCKKQVLEVDPSFHVSRLDVKRLEASSSSSSLSSNRTQ